MPVSTSWKYFPNNKGLVTGIVLCGFGFGPFFFNIITTHIVNPNNLKADSNGMFPPEVYQNVPKMFRILAACWFVLSVISIILFFPYEEIGRNSNQGGTG